MHKVYWTGIGSRNTPKHILEQMQEYACNMAKAGLVLRSGGAEGADTAFQLGYMQASALMYPTEAEIYVPWAQFGNVPAMYKRVYQRSLQAQQIARSVHPVYDKLKNAVQLLHERNVHQILGADLNTPSTFVLFYAEEVRGKVKGGTATAVHLARARGIPTINMWNNANWRQEVLQKVLGAPE